MSKEPRLISTHERPQRILWLDVARVIAILSITLNHAVDRGYSYSNQLEEFFRIPFAASVIKAVVYIFSCLGVPIFVMISGSLLLKKDIHDENGVLKFYKHNLLNLFITAEIWYAIFYIITLFLVYQKHSFNPTTIITEASGFVLNALFINQRSFNSTWYLPMVICLYLLIPLIVLVKDKISIKTSLIILFPLFYMSIIIPTCSEIFIVAGIGPLHFGMDSPFDYTVLCSMYVLYLIAGYWISNGIMKKFSNAFIIIVTVISFIATCAFQLYSYSIKEDIHLFYQSFGVFFTSVFLFECIRRGGNTFSFAKKPITYIARIAFGIYFIHIAIMSIMVQYFDTMQIAMSEPIKMIVYEAVSFIGSIIIIAPLSKIPFFKKYVFMIK